MLNACGRMAGISGLMRLPWRQSLKTECDKRLGDYKKEIVTAINWYDKNKYSPNVIGTKA
jgi:hypothetical protein